MRCFVLPFGFVTLLFFACGACGRSRVGSAELTIAAAASLRQAMPDLMAAYMKDHGRVRLVATYGASGDLRKQIEAGAPVDVVVFAASQPVDDLIAAHLAVASTRTAVATNALVLISPLNTKSYTFATLDTVPPSERIGIGDPKTVPAGQYAQAALQKIGKWDALRNRFVFGGDVTAVLAYARRGEVAAAIVYKTDLLGIHDVIVTDELKGPDAPRIADVAAVTTAAKNVADAKDFVSFLGSTAAKQIFENYGFGAP